MRNEVARQKKEINHFGRERTIDGVGKILLVKESYISKTLNGKQADINKI
jgi:hypothetical protein